MANFPSSHPSLPTNSTNETVSEDVHPALHNNVNAEVNAIAAELGTNPSGDYSTVADAIGDMLEQIAALESGEMEGYAKLADPSTFTGGTQEEWALTGQSLSSEDGLGIRGTASGIGVQGEAAASGSCFKAAGHSSATALDANNRKIVNVPAPTEDSHAATKKYVDDQIGSPSSWTTVSSFNTGWSGSVRWRWLPDEKIEIQIRAGGLAWSSGASSDVAFTIGGVSSGNGIGFAWHDSQQVAMAVRFNPNGDIEFVRSGSNGEIEEYQRIIIPLIY